MIQILVLLIICVIIYATLGRKQSNKQVLVDPRLITFYPCKPFKNELTKKGYAIATPYKDKNGRTRYCCNPNHNHYFE